MRNKTILASAALVATAGTARAQATRIPTDTGEERGQYGDTVAYCAFVSGIADSESALDMSPTLFATGGIASGADVSPGASVLGPTTRLIGGVSYSASGLYRGLARRAGAEAECQRYKTVSQLHAFLEANREGLTRASLVAKLSVLNQALPRAQEMLGAARAALARSDATLEQVEAMQLRVDALQALTAQTKQDLLSLSHLPSPPSGPMADVLRDRDKAEAAIERYEARVRESRAWDVSVRGGYDRIFGTSFSYSPVFALATVSWNVGALLQPSAEQRASEGRVRWSRSQIEGVDDRVEQALVRLRSVRDTERERREETRILLKDLEDRYESLLALPGQKVADYAQYVWFDLVRTRAEYAYLQAHVADLDRLLGLETAPQ